MDREGIEPLRQPPHLFNDKRFTVSREEHDPFCLNKFRIEDTVGIEPTNTPFWGVALPFCYVLHTSI